MLYIAVGGNTGSGKSTLVEHVAKQLFERRRVEIEPVNERQFHHPFLTNMFFDPKRFALPIQLNFLLQRSLYIMEAMRLGRGFVIERSHHEDPYFVKDHFDKGNMTIEEYTAYEAIKIELHKSLPAPKIYVRLRVSPDVSMARIKKDEAMGKRPEEFPSEEVFKEFVEAWFGMYEEFFAEIDQGIFRKAFKETTVLDADPSRSPLELADEVIDALDDGIINNV